MATSRPHPISQVCIEHTWAGTALFLYNGADPLCSVFFNPNDRTWSGYAHISAVVALPTDECEGVSVTGGGA